MLICLFHRRKWLVPWQQWESTMSKLKSRGLKTRPIRCWWRGERKLIIWLLKMRRLLAKDTFTVAHAHTFYTRILVKIWFKEAITQLKVFFIYTFLFNHSTSVTNTPLCYQKRGAVQLWNKTIHIGVVKQPTFTNLLLTVFTSSVFHMVFSGVIRMLI